MWGNAMPTGWQGRAVAMLILLLALGSVYAGIAAPLLGLYNGRASELEDRQRLSARLAAAAGRLPSLHRRIDELRSAKDESQGQLVGASDALAAANLQSDIEELAAAAGIAIASSEGLPLEMRVGFRRIGIRLAVRAPYETLLKFLAAIETTSPSLIVDNLHISGVLTQTAGTDLALDAGLEVYGFRIGAEPKEFK